MPKPKKKLLLVSSFALIGVLGVAASFSLASTESFSVSAGSSLRYAMSSSTVVDSRINSGDLRTSGDVKGEDSTLVLGEGKAIAKMKINNYVDAGLANVYNASFDVSIKTLEEGGKFRICSALPGVSSSYDGEGSLVIEIENQYGFYFLSVTEYLGEGITNELYKKEEAAWIKNAKNLSFVIRFETDGTYNLSINGNKILADAEALGSGAGYFGFMSEGANEIRISSLNVYGYTYSSPENVPSYVETFDEEKGHYNANYFYSSSSAGPISPSYLAVDEDTGRLHFSNVGNSQITTRYMYSNFSMEFEIPEMQKEVAKDEEGNITSPITSNFGISWGESNVTDDPGNTWMYHTWIHFENLANSNYVDHTVQNDMPFVTLYSSRSALHRIVLPEEYRFFSPKETRIPTIKITMIDGVVDLYLKWDDGEYGASFFHYDLGQTEEGYVRILTLGDTSMPSSGVKYLTSNNFSIDNLTLKNLDAESYRQETNVGYKANGITGGTDFNYTTTPDDGDLIGNKLGGKKSEAKNALPYALGISSVLAALSASLYFFFKRS